MTTLRNTARLAGLLYFFVVLAGPFVLLYVPGKIFVAGDASATAANILAHEALFRANIVVGLLGELCFIGAVLALFQLLKGVDLKLATVMVILILLDAPLAFLSVANEVATLTILRGGELLAVFNKPQRDALATLLLEFDRQGVFVSELFWGLWLLPLGLLVYRSRFLPRLLGAWLFVNGLAYVALAATGLLVPEHVRTVSNLVTPILFGEMALMLWLLIVGAREPRATVTAESSPAAASR